MISTGSLLLGIALLLVVGLVVIRPLMSPSADEATFAHAADPVTRRQALEAQKDALLEQIRDLDFDRETGKVPEDRYQQRRTQLTTEAADIFRQLDVLAPAANGGRPTGDRAVDHEIIDEVDVDEIEAAVSRLRKRPSADRRSSDGEASTAAVEDAEAEIEAAIARRRDRQDEDGAEVIAASSPVARDSARKRARFCPQCGESLDPEDKFCAHCGHRLA